MSATHNKDRSPTRRAARWTARRVLIALPVLALTLLVAGCLNAGERLAYFPTRDAFTTPPGYTDVVFETESGAKLHGWFIPGQGTTPDTPAPAVLFTHGNAGNLKNHHAFCNFIADRGIHVFLFDYRGYGRSDDAFITRDTVYQDALAAYDTLTARPDVDPQRIAIYGMSMGGQPALRVAANKPEIRAVATLSTYSSWDGIAADFLPVLGPLLIHNNDSAVEYAAKLGNRPYWVGHGDSDSIVNARHAPILYQAAADAGTPAELHLYPNGNHISMLFTHPESAESLTDFLAEHLGARPEPPSAVP